MNITVLGASGGGGRAITTELVARGHAVTAVNRRGDLHAPPGVRVAAADLYDPEATRRVCAGADVVVFAAMPPYHAWAGNFDRMLDSVLDAAATAQARFVFVDNLYMHGPAAGPISERSPEHATGKGALRRRIAQRILTDDRLSATAGRYSDYYGPGGTNSFVHSMFLEPALAGRRMRIMLDADQPHTFHYLADAARGFATLVEQPAADGRAWVLPAAPPLTQGELAALVNSLLPEPVGVGRLSPGMVAVASVFSRSAREGRKTAHQFDRPWVVDASAFEAAFGQVQLTDHETALAATISWLRGQAGTPSGATRR